MKSDFITSLTHRLKSMGLWLVFIFNKIIKLVYLVINEKCSVSLDFQ
nr:MAG TPA_asm: hypothetical protein [Caudoviricetes sp.]